MNNDKTYCNGAFCPIKQMCKRYLPKPLKGKSTWWVEPDYDPVTDKCFNFK